MVTADDAAAQETFWQQVETNLHAGRIRMLFVADEIPTPLAEHKIGRETPAKTPRR